MQVARLEKTVAPLTPALGKHSFHVHPQEWTHIVQLAESNTDHSALEQPCSVSGSYLALEHLKYS